MLYCFISVIVIWLAGDFAYSRYVAYRIQQWESTQVFGDDGIQQGAEEFGLGPEDSSTAILMVHGFCDSPQIYRKLAPALAERGYYCRGILLPGFGRNIEAYAASRREDWHNKLDAEIRHLTETHDQVLVVAHSLGGALTINYLLQDAHAELDGVVLLAPAIEVSDERSPIGTARFWHEVSKWALPFSRIAHSPFQLDVREPSEQNRPERNRFSPRTVVDQTFQLMDENRARAGDLDVPLLMFVSPEDKIISTPAIETYYRGWAGEPKKLVRLENSGHMIPVDLDWKTVESEIAEFATRTGK